jgi:hypothetical protein
MLTEKEVLERAFRALDEVAGPQVKIEAVPHPLRDRDESATFLECTSGAAEITGMDPAEPSVVRDRTAKEMDWSRDGIPWADWKAEALNRLFLEQGVTGQPGKITAATVLQGERIRK